MVMASTGVPIWLSPVSKANVLSANSMPDIVASPVISSGVAVVKSYSGRTKAFEVATGREIWVRETGGISTPAADAGVLFDVDGDGFAAAIDLASGKSIWSTKLEPKDASAYFHDPLLVNNQMLVTNSAGEMIKLDPYSGKIISTERLASRIDASPIVIGDKLILVSGGDLVVFR
jgi:outer membrane protein assembly factor BamB